jgi:rubrerythrin
MGFSLKSTCVKCGKDMDPSDIRAIEGGKRFMCRSCFEEKNKGPLSTNSGLPLRDSSSQPTQNIISSSKKSFFDYKEWVCSSCNYKFKRSPEFIVSVCPFCGKSDAVSQKVDQPADELLKDWSEL